MLFQNNDRNKSLTIVIHTPYRGPGNLPAVYVMPEESGVIRGYVQFQSTEDIQGGNLDLAFRVKSEARWSRQRGEGRHVYHSKQVLQRQAWNIPIHHSRHGVVAAGTTRFDFEAFLDPHCPSSIQGRRGWLNYRFRATLHRSLFRRNLVIRQDVWVFSSRLPISSDMDPCPHVHTGIWQSYLPFTVSIPSENIHLGQRLPMTVQFEPFVRASGLYGQELVIISAVVKLKQYTRLWHRRNVKNETKEVLNVPVHYGWPQTAQGLQRTLWVDIPHAPRLSCTTYTQPVRKTHRLKIIMSVKTAAMTDRDAKELRVEMGVNVTGPRPPAAEELPPYSAVWEEGSGGVDSD
ncbi:hypothetical protein BGZ70_002103 [Mortierella alpina]|uniref:Arrestin-like N-terminal domain-containing protein n=1 Tax=Mortierella alpina TaxID=64518 RepID=A0A9P6JEL4_MORAP|nr:hypothetical protein BGZ70_002103 [Mortierella alpina]